MFTKLIIIINKKGGVLMHKVYLNLEKGGTGRTLSLYHLAWTFGDLFNKKVLIVDLDSQKNVSFLFGVDGNTLVAEGGCSMAHVLFKNLNSNKKRRSIKDCIIKDVAPNVDIAYTSSELKDTWNKNHKGILGGLEVHPF